MTDRRTAILTLAAGVAALGAPGLLRAAEKGPVLIKGTPPKLDFGGGLVIPMDRNIFKTLWEGQDRWITYGHASGKQKVEAMGLAEQAAVGTMKLMLLTLAFKPERLERVDGGGWRLKSGNTADLVRGDLALPGRPVMPTVDEYSSEGEGGDPLSHAITGYMLMKKDVSLDDVRASAHLLASAG